MLSEFELVDELCGMLKGCLELVLLFRESFGAVHRFSRCVCGFDPIVTFGGQLAVCLRCFRRAFRQFSESLRFFMNAVSKLEFF